MQALPRASCINLDVENDIGPTGSRHLEPQAEMPLDYYPFVDFITDFLQQITNENSYKIFLLLQAQLRCKLATHIEDDSFIKSNSRPKVDQKRSKQTQTFSEEVCPDINNRTNSLKISEFHWKHLVSVESQR